MGLAWEALKGPDGPTWLLGIHHILKPRHGPVLRVTALPDDLLQHGVVMLFLVGFRDFIVVGSSAALAAASALAGQGHGQEAAAWRLLRLDGILLRDPALRKARIATAAQAFAGMQGAAPCRSSDLHGSCFLDT